MGTETITWIACAEQLPDADINVLVYDRLDELVREGWLDDDDHDGSPVWRDVTAMRLIDVTHWAEMPAGPGVE